MKRREERRASSYKPADKGKGNTGVGNSRESNRVNGSGSHDIRGLFLVSHLRARAARCYNEGI